MIRPLADRVFVKPIRQTETASGLALVSSEADTTGEVVAVGEGVASVKVGDVVLLAPMSGLEARINYDRDESYIILSDSEILAVFE